MIADGYGMYQYYFKVRVLLLCLCGIDGERLSIIETFLGVFSGSVAEMVWEWAGRNRTLNPFFLRSAEFESVAVLAFFLLQKIS